MTTGSRHDPTEAAPASGVCRHCDRRFRLTAGGKVFNHGDGKAFPPVRCPGAGQPPKES